MKSSESKKNKKEFYKVYYTRPGKRGSSLDAYTTCKSKEVDNVVKNLKKLGYTNVTPIPIIDLKD